MKALFLLLVLPHVGGQPSPWQGVSGVDKVQYRWSRPASNSCLVEFNNAGASQPPPFTAGVTFVSNRPTKPLQPKGLPPKKSESEATIVRDQISERQLPVHLVKLGTYATSIEDCYRIVLVKAVVPSSTDKTETADKPGKMGPE